MDAAAANVLLDAWLGATKAAGVPASLDLALFDAHPDDGGNELDATGGYARVPVATDGTVWPAAVGGRKESVDIALAGTSTYNTTARWWALYSGTTRYFTMPLAEPVTEPTDTVTLVLALSQNPGL